MVKANALLAQGVKEEIETNRFSLLNVFNSISKEEIRDVGIYIYVNIKLERGFSEKNLQIGVDLAVYKEEKRFVKELFSVDMEMDLQTDIIDEISLNPFSKEINIIQQINDITELGEGTYDLITYKKEEGKKRVLDVTQFIIN